MPIMPPEAPEELDTLEGVLERIVYENELSGFFVGRLLPRGGPDDLHGEPVPVVGYTVALSPGETVRLRGHWVDDPKFGRQFRIEQYDMVRPTSAEGIEKYLGSGLVKGIGPKLAKRLVKAFGADTLRVIEEEPKRLRKVEGIGRKRIGQIQDSWQSQQALKNIMMFLQGHGITTAQAVRIYKQYGDRAAAVLRENPYRLAEDISGIAFKTADAIARQMGIEKDAQKRAEAGLFYVLQQAASEAHVFLPEHELIERTAELLEIPPDALELPIESLAEREVIVREKGGAFLRHLHQAEVECALYLKRLLEAKPKTISIKIDAAIAWIEKHHAITLSEEQRQAVRYAAMHKLMVITGGPGTGKTTVLNGILAMFEKKGLRMLLAAPTGRAANRMERATGRSARTIHRLLEYSPQQGGFLRNEERTLETDLLVVDECSMVDVLLMKALLSAVPPSARVIIVGDVDQLPSVGPGNVLMDIIASNILPAVRLETVYRQAAQSGIVTNAHRINRGQMPEYNTEDFFFVERKEPHQVLDTVVELAARRMPERFQLDPVRDIQVLSPMHRGDAGVSRLNEALQEALNPRGKPVPGKPFRLGDKVMQLRNNYELEVYNGDTGRVVLVEEEAKEIQVDFEDRSVLYGMDETDQLALAYAATVHKSQGSEYPAVVLPLLPQHYMLLQRNLLYTAITRASRLLVIVGETRAISMAVRNTKVAKRHSRLSDRLRHTGEGA